MNIQDVISNYVLFSNSRPIDVKPLNGDLFNETHIVTADSIPYVVKLNYPQNQYLGLLRKTEDLLRIKHGS